MKGLVNGDFSFLELSVDNKSLVELDGKELCGNTDKLGSVPVRPRPMGLMTADTGRGLLFGLFPSLAHLRLAFGRSPDTEILCMELKKEKKSMVKKSAL